MFMMDMPSWLFSSRFPCLTFKENSLNPSLIRLSEMITPARIIELDVLPKESALKHLCDTLRSCAEVRDPDVFYRSILKREEQSSTGVGMGIGIPHVKIPEVTDYVMAVGRCARGIDFQSHDGQPVHLIFLIGSSDRQTREFVKILASLTKLLKSERNRKELLEADTPGVFIRLLREYESA
jgi:mannitol/fructose-specific phosphotransferase system IIA component (Ntr-type)